MTENTTPAVAANPRQRRSLVEKFAGKYGLEPDKMMVTLKDTAFKQKGRNAQPISNEQMAALVIVADQYNLNPWTKEIYAYPDNGGIVPVVGVDGWSRIINEHEMFDGLEFKYAEELAEGAEHKPCPVWIECVVHRKDRAHPITVREYFDECYRPPFKQGMRGPWQTHTRRMMRHKVLIQAARVAFGFTGIHDQDEAERIIESDYIDVTPQAAPEGATTTDKIKSKLGIASNIGDHDSVADAGDTAVTMPAEVETNALEDDRQRVRDMMPEGEAPLEVDPETGEVLPPELQGE